MESYLEHYGTPRHSGRYPWGSGEEPYQHSRDFVSRYTEYEKQGLTHDKILENMHMKTTEYRAMNALANAERRAYEIQRIESLKADGLNNSEIARKLGYPSESTVRSLLDEKAKNNTQKALSTANYLKETLNQSSKKFIDIGAGVEKEMGISAEKLKVAETILKAQGYEVYAFRVPQASNPGKFTTVRVLCPPGTQYKEAYDARDKGEIGTIVDYEQVKNINEKNVETRQEFKYPTSVDSKRVKVRFKDEKDENGFTGEERDGMVEIRPGVKDLSLGTKAYAQVRILVDGTHYIKGMAVYNPNMPEGTDIIVNSNKPKEKGKLGALKEISTEDPNNPFGSLIKDGGQSYYIDDDGKKKLSAINKRAEEGDWGQWADKLASQFLVKQNNDLIKRQLNLTLSDKEAEYEEICSLTNPTLKKKLLENFANECDASAVCLKAAALPRQKYQVILPIPSLKDNECYAPNFNDGETVALVRFPHEGTYQIPILKVNNNNKEARRILGAHPEDAVGINKTVADRLSGADFDGDTVLVIPTNSKVKITSTPPLDGLKGFETKQYAGEKKVDSNGNEHYYFNGHEFKPMTKQNTQMEMGKASNLITDMTLKGATGEELARATRYSMTVIDAAKHKLDYKQCYRDNNIEQLKKDYQKHIDDDDYGGASTLLSSAKSVVRVPKRVGMPRINMPGDKWYDPSKPDGAIVYKTAEGKDLYYEVEKVSKRTGKVTKETRMRTQETSKMAETDDAYKLSSGEYKEDLYAAYANSLKSMANKARVTLRKTGKIEYSPEAKKKYKEEVDDLNAQLLIAEKNRPRERMAQIWAGSQIKAIKLDNPTMTKEQIGKVSQQALTRARNKFGAKKQRIKISDRQWDAIQSGAITETTLKRILDNMDTDELRKRATPKASNELSSAKISQIKAKINSGYTTTEVAEALGISASTVRKYMK